MLDARNPAQKMYIRINALDTDLTLGDLAAVIPGKPDGIVLPKCAGAADVNKLALYLDVDYYDLRERDYPLLAPTAMAERLRKIAEIFPPNPGFEFNIYYRRRG